MDTILLVIGVVGLSISGWFLRGYWINNFSNPHPQPVDSTLESGSDPNEAGGDVLKTGYVSSEEHQQVIERLEQLERAGLTPKVAQSGNLTETIQPGPEAKQSSGPTTEAENKAGEDDANVRKWLEIAQLQEAYQKEREKEKDIDYEREGNLFDLTQSYDGRVPGGKAGGIGEDEDEVNQRLLDNQFEEGEDMNEYRQRMNQFAQLSKEMLVMRLEAAETRLREQQEKHQAYLLDIIGSLIAKVPSDVNLKSVVQSSFVAASTEITDEDGEENRLNFQKMFYQNVGH